MGVGGGVLVIFSSLLMFPDVALKVSKHMVLKAQQKYSS